MNKVIYQVNYFAAAILLICVTITSSSGAAGRLKVYDHHKISRPVGGPTQWINVKDIGATGNGKVNDTRAINKAISIVGAEGGGIVYFPAGIYLSGSIRLRSNMTLYLGPGSVIEASSDPSDYDKPEPNQWSRYQDFGHSHWHNSLIWGDHVQNVTIGGRGLIYGKGLSQDKRKDSLWQGPGNKAIAFVNSVDIHIRDISILHGGHFGILVTGVSNLTIDNLKIDTNTDGIDIDCCRNVHVTNCTINSPWDDALVLKASYALGYPKATEEVTISNCYVTGGLQEGTMLNGTYEKIKRGYPLDPMGRIKIGTESVGDFKNITITNCVFEDSYGIALESVDGSNLQDITISNITMRNLSSAAVFLRLGARMQAPAGKETGTLQRINISNIIAYRNSFDTTFGGIVCISGIPGHAIEDVQLNDIQAFYQGGGTKAMASIDPPEEIKKYPEPGMFGPLPSWGIFIRHAKNVAMNNINIHYLHGEMRPAFYLEDVRGADFNHVRWQVAGGTSSFELKDVNNLWIHDCKPLSDTTIIEAVKTEL